MTGRDQARRDAALPLPPRGRAVPRRALAAERPRLGSSADRRRDARLDDQGARRSARERGHCPLRLAESGGESVDSPPVDLVVDIRLSAVYREGAGGVGALSDYVRDHRMAVDPDRGGFRFVDPTFDRSGRVVTARERRSLARVVG